MGYLGYLSVVLTALVLTGNSGNVAVSLVTQLIMANTPLFIEYLLRIRKTYKQLQQLKALQQELKDLKDAKDNT